MAYIDDTAKKCGYSDYMQKYVTYPPQGLLPLPGNTSIVDPSCDVWEKIFEAALLINPAFNMYHILDTYPVLWDVLGFPYVSLKKTQHPWSTFIYLQFFFEKQGLVRSEPNDSLL